MLAAGIACALRRWVLALRLARAVVLASPVLLVTIVVVFMVLPPKAQPFDPSMKAAMLSQGISEVMNCGVVVLAAAFPASFIWSFARSRISRKSAG
jgi:hypothetical protein